MYIWIILWLYLINVMFESYVVLVIVMLWIRFSVRTYGQRHGMTFRSKLNAPKQRLSQNRWLLPQRWCSYDYIIRTVLTLSVLCNPETSFPTPFVDFQRDNLHISDYTIQKLYKLSGLCTPNPFIQNWHQHPSGWFKWQNPRICPDFIFRKEFGLYIPN